MKLNFFSPTVFLRWSKNLIPVGLIVTTVLLGIGLYWSLFLSPDDYQQGSAVKIMYVHVPAAWFSLAAYAVLSTMSALHLIFRAPMASLLGKASAITGTAFTAVCLITGSLWGKPMWGAYWVWDARLTSMAILFFFYVGYLGLYYGFDNREHASKMASILGLVGAFNLPIVKWSVEFWSTLHQKTSFMSLSAPSIHSSMLTPLLLMAAAFASYYGTLLLILVRRDLLKQKHQRQIQTDILNHIREAA
ncbi:MAG: cytochrome c biogenesis protein CcsA [Alphaproteobacteria bacterium]|jgi:heme exporter protein C|nr:cytochrome c biogenesis protein CcsA [Alphaproteobacteria bacterium]MBT5389339.1 cytochrome c biogenesis protein CcsA [Alphaproteobacteria bacterium]MBT5654646.1 cytochrome c biogenesis protein CcsA [Alphaproteobacteria bacterium]